MSQWEQICSAIFHTQVNRRGNDNTCCSKFSKPWNTLVMVSLVFPCLRREAQCKERWWCFGEPGPGLHLYSCSDFIMNAHLTDLWRNYIIMLDNINSHFKNDTINGSGCTFTSQREGPGVKSNWELFSVLWVRMSVRACISDTPQNNVGSSPLFKWNEDIRTILNNNQLINHYPA